MNLPLRSRFQLRIRFLASLARACVLVIGLWSTAQAGMVKSVKGSKALLVFGSGEEVRVGQTVYVNFPDGSRKATLGVLSVRRGRALAEIRSGEPEEGDACKVPQPRSVPVKSSVRRSPPFWSRYGFLNVTGGLAYQSESVQLTSATSLEMSGLAPNLRVSLAGDGPGGSWWRDLSWDLGLALDRILSHGTASRPVCAGTANCELDLIGLAPSARAGYSVAPQFYDTEFTLGFQMFFPVLVTSNAIDYSTFQPLLFGSLGVTGKYTLNDNSYVPLSLEIAKYVGSADVSLYRVLVSVGYAWR